MPPKKKAASSKSAVAIPHNLTELEEVLRAFLGGDMTVVPQPNPEAMNAAISKATSVLKTFIKMPQSVPALISRISMPDSPADTRQLACVLLTKNIRPFWPKLHKSHFISPQVNDAESCRQRIMAILHAGNAPTSVVHSLSYLTAILARMDFKKNRFLELPQWLHGALESDNPLHVDAALRVMSNILTSEAGSFLHAQFEHFFARALHWLANPPNKGIRYRSLVSLSAILEQLFSDEAMEDKIGGIVDNSLSVLLQALEAAARDYDHESIRYTATIFTSLLGTPGFEKHLLMTLNGFRNMIKNIEYDFPVRDTFARFFAVAAEIYPKLITQQLENADGSGGSLLEVYLQVVGDLLCEEDEDAFDVSSKNHPHLIAIRILETLVEQMPLATLYPKVALMAFQMLQQPSDQVKKGGVLIIMHSSRECPAAFISQELLPWTDGKLITLHECARTFFAQTISGQSSLFLHTAACIMMSALADDLSVHYMDTDEFIQPLEQTLVALETAPLERRYRLICALAELSDAAKIKLVPYLSRVMHQIGLQLQINDYEQQTAAVLATTNIALSCDKQFGPYVETLRPLLVNIINAPTNDQIAQLQHAAYVCFSAALRVYGIANWSPELHQEVIGMVTHCITTLGIFEGVDLDLVDNYVVFLGNIGLCLSDLPRPYNNATLDILTSIFDTTVNALLSFEGIHFYNRDEDAQKLSGFDGAEDDEEEGYGGGDDDDDDEDHEDNEDGTGYYFGQAALAAKLSAVSTLHLLISALGPDLYSLKLSPKVNSGIGLSEEMYQALSVAASGGTPQFSMDPVIRLLEVMSQQIAILSQHVQGEHYVVLVDLLTKVLGPKCFGPEGINITPGVMHPLPAEFTNVSVPLLRILYASLGSDDEDVVGEGIARIEELLKEFGLSIFSEADEAKEFFSILQDIVSEETCCFNIVDEFAEEGSSQGETALQYAGSFIGTMASYMSPSQFFTDFLTPEFCQKVIEFCSKKRADNFRAAWIGCLAEILERTGSASQHLLPSLIPVVQELLVHPNDSVQHNALFCAAECFKVIGLSPEYKAQMSPQTVQQIFSQIVAHFMTKENYFGNPLIPSAFHDNVVSAGLRAVLTFPEILTPAQLVPQLLAIYPLHGDAEEVAKIVIEILPPLFSNATEVMRPYVGQTLAQIAISLHFKYYSHRQQDEANAVQFAKQLLASFPQEAQTAPQFLQSLHPEALEALQALAQ